MSANRKLQLEIERTLKKISEGNYEFDEIWDKVYDAPSTAQKEKFEADLKKEIKKLQRLRDQVKTWLQSNDIKDKTALLKSRKDVESRMERFKICEKETKTKAYSKEGLMKAEKEDPEEVRRNETREWLNDAMDQLRTLTDMCEAELEAMTTSAAPSKTKKRGKSKSKAKSKNPGPVVDAAEKERLTLLLAQHTFHLQSLESVLRALDNLALAPQEIDDAVKEGVQYYLESHEDEDFYDDDGLYDELDLENAVPNAAVPVVENYEAPVEVPKVVKKAQEAEKAKPKEETKKKEAEKAKPKTEAKSAKKDQKSQDTSSSSQQNAVKAAQAEQRRQQLAEQERVKREQRVLAQHEERRRQMELRQREQERARQAQLRIQQQKQQQAQQAAAAAATAQRQSDSAAAAVAAAQSGKWPSAQRGGGPQVEESVAEPAHIGSTAATSGASSMSASASAEIRAAVASSAAEALRVSSAIDQAGLGAGGQARFHKPDEQLHAVLEASCKACPLPTDSVHPKKYTPRSECNVPPQLNFPSTPLEMDANATKVLGANDPDTLFFMFYYQQGTYAQYLAARELKRQSWRYHKKYLTWFQRHEEPKIAADDYEQGAYVYFDFDKEWDRQIKSNFTFEYLYLEDDDR